MLINVPAIDWLADAICIALPMADADPEPIPAERVLVAQAVPRRRAHFAAGRACARAALSQLGHPVPALLRDKHGGPAWPPGVVGSIAHCEAMAVAIVAESGKWTALGIDVEPDRRLPEDVSAYALTASERSAVSAVTGSESDIAGLLRFSAKECVHKCVHPLTGAFLEFDEVEIELLDGQRFLPRPLSTLAKGVLSGLHCEGRWLRSGGHVWTLLGLRTSRPR